MNKKKKRQHIIGTLKKNRKGFGFLIREDGEKPDIFLHKNSLGNAMDGDTVEVELLPESFWRESPEGIVIRVITRSSSELVGVFHKLKKYGFVEPVGGRADEEIFISGENTGNAAGGDTVVVSILKYPTKNRSAEGAITEIICSKGDKDAPVKTIVRQSGARTRFPGAVLRAAGEISGAGVTTEDMEGRRDLRAEKIFTIDGPDAKDLDDAVSVKKLEDGNYVLGVHIADVSNYVKEGKPLDSEALQRGTSIYLVDQVIPMLPKELSNGICSLNKGEDRLTLSVNMEIDPKGRLVDHEIYESVICSCERLVYDDVSDIIEDPDNHPDTVKKYSHIKDQILLMDELALILRKNRDEQGSIDFDVDEAAIVLNSQGVPIDVRIACRRRANRLIEEFMLMANETVAEHFMWLGVPFVYRVHKPPQPEDVAALRTFLAGFGIVLKGNSKIHPASLSAILEGIKGDPCENIISSVVLRSMEKATYETECRGHFGLAFKYYCHFTSPIRRYPDLMIHRIIKENLHGLISPGRVEQLEALTEAVAKKSSESEVRAQELERKTEKIKKALYMSEHIGEVYDGIISGVTGYGFYVQLPNTIEGLVHVNSLCDDFYSYDEKKYMLVGERHNKTYRLGDSVTVIADGADSEKGEIDFLIFREGDVL